MTTVAPKPIVTRPWPVRQAVRGSALARLLRTTDAKQIGLMYLVTAFAFFLIGGGLALLMRAELARPGLQFLSPEQYNQLFTMHGTIMLLFFATPIVFGFANLVLPLQIGSPDVAFPRLNAFSYWLYLFGASLACAGFLTPGGAADVGWTFYTPLSDATNSPGVGIDMWIIGVGIGGLGTILGAVNMITTVICLRAPGMTLFRMPIFVWNILITSLLVLLAFPILTAALLVLWVDRTMGAQVFTADNGGAMLWQHLFWFFGHPEVYIIALPFFGIITEILPVFSRKPIFGYIGLVGATVTITGLLRMSEPNGGFLRSNDPAGGRWYSRDVKAIGAACGLSGVAPFFVDADATPNPGGYPVGGLTVVAFDNNHLVYALTWFGLALLCAVGSFLMLRAARSR